MGFVFVNAICLLSLLREYFKIRSVSTSEVIDVPAVMFLGQEVKPATQASPQAYEMGLWKEHFKEASIGPLAICFIYMYSGSIMPMMMQTTRTVFKIYESPLFKVHILGKNLTRPYGLKSPDWKALQARKKALQAQDSSKKQE